jgi:hypothetical protein
MALPVPEGREPGVTKHAQGCADTMKDAAKAANTEKRVSSLSPPQQRCMALYLYLFCVDSLYRAAEAEAPSSPLWARELPALRKLRILAGPVADEACKDVDIKGDFEDIAVRTRMKWQRMIMGMDF